MTITLDQYGEISSGDTETVKVSFKSKLEGSELLTGTPNVAEVTTSDLTLSAGARNSAEYTDLGDQPQETVAIDQGVTFTVSGSTAGSYLVKVTATTDAGNTLSRNIKITVV